MINNLIQILSNKIARNRSLKTIDVNFSFTLVNKKIDLLLSNYIVPILTLKNSILLINKSDRTRDTYRFN